MLLEVRLLAGEPSCVRLSEAPSFRSRCRGSRRQTDFNIISGMVAGLCVKGWMGAINSTKYNSPIARANTLIPATNYGSTQYMMWRTFGTPQNSSYNRTFCVEFSSETGHRSALRNPAADSLTYRAPVVANRVATVIEDKADGRCDPNH